MSVVLILGLILASGALAFAVTKTLGARFGVAAVGLVTALNVPHLLAYFPVLFPTPITEGEPYLPPAEASLGAGGYMFLGAATFAGLTIISAIVGSNLGRRVRRRHLS